MACLIEPRDLRLASRENGDSHNTAGWIKDKHSYQIESTLRNIATHLSKEHLKIP